MRKSNLKINYVLSPFLLTLMLMMCTLLIFHILKVLFIFSLWTFSSPYTFLWSDVYDFFLFIFMDALELCWLPWHTVSLIASELTFTFIRALPCDEWDEDSRGSFSGIAKENSRKNKLVEFLRRINNGNKIKFTVLSNEQLNLIKIINFHISLNSNTKESSHHILCTYHNS